MDLRNFGQKNSTEEQEIKDKAQKYSGMGQDDLVNELMGKVMSAKNDGSFNYGELVSFANNIFPFLNEEQRARMVDILRLIGNE